MTRSPSPAPTDPVALIALAACAGGACAVAPGPTAASFAACAAWLFAARRASARLVLAAAVALLFGAVRARAGLASAEAAHARASVELAPPQRCAGSATVLRSPVAQSRGGAEPLRLRADVRLEGLVCTKRPHRRAQLAEADARLDRRDPRDPDTREIRALDARVYGLPDDARRGDRYRVHVDLAATHLFENLETRSPFVAIARSGVVASGSAAADAGAPVSRPGFAPGALVDRARAFVRARIEATFHPAAAPLARALVLGEADLVPDDDEAFRKSGLAHLLAVSGSHLVLAVVSLVAALRAVLARVPAVAARCDVGRVASAAGVALAFAYADFAGGSGSAMRAAYMLAASLGARALGRRPTAVRSLALSLAAGALADPFVALDPSFVLSAAATAGLVFFARPVERGLAWLARRATRGRAVPGLVAAAAGKLGGATATSLAAMAACAPALATMAPELPLVGLAANLLAAPLGEVFALPVCLLHAIASPVGALEQGAALVGSGSLLAVRAVAVQAANLGHGLGVPEPTALELALAAPLVCVAWTGLAGRGRALRLGAALALVAGLVAAELAARRAGAPTGVLRVTVLDVAQGDAVLVDLPDGRALLVDAGGLVGSPVDTGARVVAPVLRARRRRGVDVLALSHPHPDHFGGLGAVLARGHVREFWDTGQGLAHGAGPDYAALHAALVAKGVPVLGPRELCGAPRDYGGARVEVLAPCPGFDEAHGANDNSLVVKITFGARAALLVGDAELEGERALLERVDLGRVDFLKVGHHGSRTSSSADLLAQIRPDVAAISCGVRNGFGHPHAEVLARLAAAGAAVHRTDQGGAVAWTTDGERTWVARPAR